MIQNDEQLNETRTAIAHLESALETLKRDVLPLNPARFALIDSGCSQPRRERLGYGKGFSGRYFKSDAVEVRGNGPRGFFIGTAGLIPRST